MIKYMKHNIKNNFDVTVVGCGPAGAQVAKKLSDAGKSICCIPRVKLAGPMYRLSPLLVYNPSGHASPVVIPTPLVPEVPVGDASLINCHNFCSIKCHRTQ